MTVKNVLRFDQAAEEWDSNPTRVALAQGISEAVASRIPLQQHWRALDYGSGTGLVTLNLLSRVESVVAVDTSEGMLGKLRQKLEAAGIENVRTSVWNLETAPFPDGNFDFVVSSMTLHHVQDVPLVFKRLALLLKPGGWAALADLDQEDGSFHTDSSGVFHHGFDRSRIADWLAAADFCSVSVENVYSVQKPAATGELRNYPVFLAVGQKPGNSLGSSSKPSLSQ